MLLLLPSSNTIEARKAENGDSEHQFQGVTSLDYLPKGVKGKIIRKINGPLKVISDTRCFRKG